MQLWVSKLNKNKWKITLIILSVALVTSCIFGFTSAWFNKVEQAKANVGMDVKYVDIFAGGDGETNQLIPAKYYTIENAPNVLVDENDGTYCVFLKIKETGGEATVNYINYTQNDDWHELSNSDAKEKFGFKIEERAKYFYQIIEANGQKLPVFNSENADGAQFQANPDLTLAQVKAAIDAPVTLSVVAAGCKTTAPVGGTTLPSAQEVAFAEVYTAFF